MKLIDASRAYDGQGPFLNGLHDGIRLPNEKRLYRKGHEWARLNHFLWSIGRLLSPCLKGITKT